MQAKTKTSGMGWLRATYLTVGSFINFLFAVALVASAYAYIIPPDKMILPLI